MGRRGCGGKKPSIPVVPDGEKVLALDVASASGYCFGAGGTILKWNKYSTDTDAPMGLKLLRFSKWLSKVINELPSKPDVVLVELPFLGNNPNTYAILNRFIGIVQREVYRILSLECVFMTPRDVKRRLGLPKARTHKQHKLNMIKRVNALLGTTFQYVENRTAKEKRSDDDIADAIGLLLAYWLREGVISDE